MQKSKYIIFLLLFGFHLVGASESEWTQSELTQEFMETKTKDQCMQKTIASLKTEGPSEKHIVPLAGITGDCVTWASGEIEQFCESYGAKYVRAICSTNSLDARDCVLIHTMHQVFCFTPKYP